MLADEHLRALIVREAYTWLGTPYHHNARVRGVGVDCALYMAEVFSAVGLVAHIEPGPYAHDWHLHRSEEVLERWVLATGAHRVESPRAGDVALFRFGRTFSHGAIVVDDDGLMLHAYVDQSVRPCRATEAPLAGRVCRYYSLIGKPA